MMQMDQQADDCVGQIRGALEHALDAGLELPLCVAIVAVNGEMSLGFVDRAATGPHLDYRVVAQHAPTGVLMPPINVMLVDPRGEAARVVIRGPHRPVLAG